MSKRVKRVKGQKRVEQLEKQMSSKWAFLRDWGAGAWGNCRKWVGIWACKVWRESERYRHNQICNFDFT